MCGQGPALNKVPHKILWGVVETSVGGPRLMDPDPDPTPNPTPFFSDFKDAKRNFSHIFSYNLLTGPLSQS